MCKLVKNYGGNYYANVSCKVAFVFVLYAFGTIVIGFSEYKSGLISVLSLGAPIAKWIGILGTNYCGRFASPLLYLEIKSY